MPEKYGIYLIEIAGLGKSLSFDLISTFLQLDDWQAKKIFKSSIGK